jgi:serine/threonine-protein kinase PRP4
MASRRSRSPSTPSEGEIVESGSETKATTSQLPLNGTSVDRQTRVSTSSALRSPASVSRSPRRRRSRTRTRSRSISRSRSRSPYRDYRGEKRRREDDYHERRYRNELPRRGGPRHNDDRNYNRGPTSHVRSRPYHDYDRDDYHGGGLRYSDDYDRRGDKRPRTRSRSPYREVRKPKQYSGDEWDSHREGSVPSRDTGRRRSSTEQLVSERGKPPVVAQDSRQDAEVRKNQVQQVPSHPSPRVEDRYAFPVLFEIHNS